MARRARGTRHDARPLPAHPYRDAAIVYGVMAALLVLVASLTGGDAARAILVAVVFFVVATVWTWWRLRARLEKREQVRTAARSAGSGGDHANGGGRGAG